MIYRILRFMKIKISYENYLLTFLYSSAHIHRPVFVEEGLELPLGSEDVGEVVPHRPVRQLVQSLVRQQVLVHQECLGGGTRLE